MKYEACHPSNWEKELFLAVNNCFARPTLGVLASPREEVIATQLKTCRKFCGRPFCRSQVLSMLFIALLLCPPNSSHFFFYILHAFASTRMTMMTVLCFVEFLVDTTVQKFLLGSLASGCIRIYLFYFPFFSHTHMVNVLKMWFQMHRHVWERHSKLAPYNSILKISFSLLYLENSLGHNSPFNRWLFLEYFKNIQLVARVIAKW